MSTSSRSDRRALKKGWPLALGSFALVLWVCYGILALSVVSPDWIPTFLDLPKEDNSTTILARRGQFGDAFGAFNALVSTFALIGLFFTIRSQQEQIETQIEMSKSSDLLVRQQQFQEQYYRAVDAYRELLAEITFNGDSKVNDGFKAQATCKGRLALWAIWRTQLIAVLESGNDDELSVAIRRQVEAYGNEQFGKWNTNQKATDALQGLLVSLEQKSELMDMALTRIGSAWAQLYRVNRFQLDALFRAWYTAYRVLASARLYSISDASIRLYSAVFRAQLSWIEMVFLLANQSGLPSNPTYPKACHFSNTHASFDNLDGTHDAVVAVLVKKANGNSDNGCPETAVLCSKAFRTDAA